MSSLAPGHLLQGARWDYRIVDAVKGDSTHTSTVYKAKVLPRENATNVPKWLVIRLGRGTYLLSTVSKF